MICLPTSWSSDYLDVHPGGLATLQEYAGRDASAAFAASHNDGADLLTKSPYDSTRIGRMVEEIPADQLQANHIALDKWVYDITGKVPSPFSLPPP